MSYLRDYLKSCEPNEGHDMHHLWTALVTLSTLVGRRIWIDQGTYVVYCNLYVVLVSPPGKRKTTAMSQGKKLLREIGGVNFSAEAMSKEGLVKEMAQNEQSFMVNGLPKTYCPITVMVTELKEFIGVSNERMINFLTTIYDQDFYDYKTRNQEPISISNPYLTILACETPEWITLRLKDDVISGGFSRRAVWAYPDPFRKRIAFPKEHIKREHEEAWLGCLKRGQELKNVSGEFSWEPEAREWYRHWYENLKVPQDSTMSGYFESKQNLLLKVAMLIAVSEEDALIMRKGYLTAALHYLDIMEVNLPKVFEGIGRNELNMLASKILDVIVITKEPISEKQLRSITWRYGNDMEFTQALNHLNRSEKITMWDEGQKPPKRMICLKGEEPKKVKDFIEKAALRTQQKDGADQVISQPSPAQAVGPYRGSTLRADPSSEQSSTLNGIIDQLLQSQRNVPSSSVEEGVKPQTDEKQEV